MRYIIVLTKATQGGFNLRILVQTQHPAKVSIAVRVKRKDITKQRNLSKVILGAFFGLNNREHPGLWLHLLVTQKKQ